MIATDEVLLDLSDVMGSFNNYPAVVVHLLFMASGAIPIIIILYSKNTKKSED